MRNIFMTEIIIELGYSHAVMHQVDGEEVKKSVTQMEESNGICMEEYPKKIISYYSSAFTINPQPRRRSVRSFP